MLLHLDNLFPVHAVVLTFESVLVSGVITIFVQILRGGFPKPSKKTLIRLIEAIGRL